MDNYPRDVRIVPDEPWENKPLPHDVRAAQIEEGIYHITTRIFGGAVTGRILNVRSSTMKPLMLAIV